MFLRNRAQRLATLRIFLLRSKKYRPLVTKTKHSKTKRKNRYQQRNNRLTMNQQNKTNPHDESILLWQQCRSTFRRSRGDLISSDYVDPAVQQHMEFPPILATLDEHTDEPMSVHYFAASRAEYDSDSEVECVALPISRTSSKLPLVPLRRNHSIYGPESLKEWKEWHL